MTIVASHVGLALLLTLAAWWTGRRSRWVEVSHTLWVLLFIKLLVPPVIELPLLTSPEAGREAAATERGESPSEPLTLTETPIVTRPLPDVAVLDGRVANAEKLAPIRRTPASNGPTPSTLILLTWAFGAAWFLVFAVRGIRRGSTMLRVAAEPDAQLKLTIADVSREVGLTQAPRTALVDENVSPSIVLGLPTRMVLPRSLLARLSPTKLRAIISHELTHLARRDHWVRILELAVLSVFWWCPPVWWCRNRLRDVEEKCCDRRAVASFSGDARDYAEALIETAATLKGRATTNVPGLVTGAGALEPLEERLTMIMTTPHGARTARRLSTAIFCAGLLMLPFGLGYATPTHEDSTTSPGLEEAPSFRGEQELVSLVDDEAVPCSQRDAVVLREAMALMRQDEMKRALALLRAVRDDKSSAKIDATIGHILRLTGDLEGACKSYEEAVRRYPDYKKAWVALTQLRAARANPQGAIAAARRAIACGEDSAMIHGLIGDALVKMGDLEAGITTLQKAHTLEPDELRWITMLARAHLQNSDRARALRLMKDAAERWPERKDILAAVAAITASTDDPEATLSAFERAREKGALTRDAAMTLSRFLIKAERYEDGVDVLLDTVGEGEFESALDVARFLLKKNRNDLVARILDRLETFESTRLHANFRKLRLQNERATLGTDDLETDVTLLKELLRLEPENGKTLLELGNLYRKQRRFEEARRLYHLAAKQRGFEYFALLGEAMLEMNRRDSEAALALGTRALKLRPDEGPAVKFVARLRELLEAKKKYRETEAQKAILIAVTAEGAVIYGGREIGLSGVGPLVKRMQKAKDRAVVIQSEVATPSGVLVRVIDEAKTAGAKRVSLAPAPSPKLADEPPVEEREEVAPDEISSPRLLSPSSPPLNKTLRDRTPATVWFMLTVDEMGVVGDPVVEKSTDALFETLALEHVKKLTFEPAKRNGQPVKKRIRFPMRFAKRR